MALRFTPRTLYSIKLSNLAEYFVTLEKGLAKRLEQQIADLEQGYNLSDAEHYEEFSSIRFQFENYHNEELVRYHRYMYVVQVIVQFELMFAEICKTWADVNGFKIQMPRDGKVNYCKPWLESHSIKIPKQWDFLYNAKIVRDCIVHTNGVVSEASQTKDKLWSQARSIKHSIKIAIEDDRIDIGEDYCKHLTLSLDSFIDDLLVSLKAKDSKKSSPNVFAWDEERAEMGKMMESWVPSNASQQKSK